jgi:hypothetical protein
VVHHGDAERGIPPHTEKYEVAGLKQFLPAGPVAEADPGGHHTNTGGIRNHHLLQFYSDRGQNGSMYTVRTVAVANIRLKESEATQA